MNFARIRVAEKTMLRLPVDLRGGSWNNNADNARVSSRNHNHSDNQNNNGFRLVVRPTSFAPILLWAFICLRQMELSGLLTGQSVLRIVYWLRLVDQEPKVERWRR